MLQFQLRKSDEEMIRLGNDVGLDCGMKRGKVVMDLEHYLLHTHSLHSQAVLF